MVVSDSSSSPTPPRRILGLFLDHVDHVVDGEHADEAPVFVDDGGGEQVVLLEELRGLFLVHLRRDGMVRLAHHRLDLRAARRAQDTVEIDGAEQAEGGIDDEDLREALRKVRILAQIVDRLADRPERRHGDKFGLHAPAGRAFRIVQRAAQADPFGERQLGEDLFLVLLVEVLQDVDGVVRIHLADRGGDLLVRQVLDDIEADRLVHLGQRGKVEVRAEQRDELAALFRLDRLQKVAHFRFVQPRDVAAQEQEVAVGDGRADMHEEVRADRTVLGIDILAVEGAVPCLVFENAAIVAGVFHRAAPLAGVARPGRQRGLGRRNCCRVDAAPRSAPHAPC